MQRQRILIALVSFLAISVDSTARAQASTAIPLKVMSFNIHNYDGSFWFSELFVGFPVQTVGNLPPIHERDYHTVSGTRKLVRRAWGERTRYIVDIVKTHKPAVIGLQEAYVDQVVALRKILPQYAHFGRGRRNGGFGESASILFDTSKVRQSIIDTPFGNYAEGGTFWFSDNPSEEGSQYPGSSGPERIATWVRLKEKATGKHFYVFNVHLQSGKDAEWERVKSVRLLLTRISERRVKDSVIALGDFNSSPSGTPTRMMSATLMTFDMPFGAPSYEWNNPYQMFDSYRMKHATDAGGTLCKTVLKNLKPDVDVHGSRIDYIFVTPGMNVVSSNRVSVGGYAFCPSDHVPVVAELVLP